ncbi:MAG: sel1 repeat family protein [Gammaproteobacteria bacterium]|nr:sel1 repeat family protein [Gammaproteobacteria bacterium]
MKLNVWVVGFFVVVTMTPMAQAGFDEAVAAANDGKYGIAFKEFSALAEQNDARAQQALGWMYYEGQGRARDYQQAAFWYRKAADQGNVTAQINLAQMYAYGKGVTQDFAEAARWWEKLAEQGDGRAQSALAELYYAGSGVARSVDAAVRWWREAAEQGIVAAQRHLGLMYGKGQGVAQDDVQAYAWLNAAALQDDMSAEKSRDFALSQLSEAQRAQAETLAAQYAEKFVEPFREKNKKPH